MQYTLSARATRDIRNITDYIAKDNPGAARKVAGRIRESIRQIAGFPNLGHAHADLRDSSLRVYRVYSYLIVYRTDAKRVSIVSVVHGARDLKRVFRKG